MRYFKFVNLARNTRFSKIQHLFEIKLTLTEQTHSPLRLSLWLLEAGTRRPSSQLRITFSISRPASTDTFTTYPIPEMSSSFHDQGSTSGYRGCTFLVQLLLVSISLQKKKKNLENFKFQFDYFDVVRSTMS